MIWLIGLAAAVYLVGFLVAGTVITRNLACGRLEFADAVMGACAALVWPVLAVPGGLYLLAKMETPKERHDRLAIEKDARVREQAWRIAQLEREAGL